MKGAGCVKCRGTGYRGRTAVFEIFSATPEIKSLITDSVERATQGAQQADQAGTTMGEIVGSIQRVSDLMAEISSATRQQTAGIAEVSSAVAEMDHTTQSNSALVEETASAADSLRDQAGRLASEMSAFTIDA